MARIRTIKPGFFRDHDIAKLPLSARLTFIGLWTYVDDEGRGVDDPRLVKGDLWQLDDKHTVKKVDQDLQILAKAGRIERYEMNGRRYLRVVKWKQHQKINRPSDSVIPASFSERSGKPPVPPTEDSGQEGKGMERKGSGIADDCVSEEPSALVSSPAPSGGDDRPDTKYEPEVVDLAKRRIDETKKQLRGEAS